MARRRRNPQRVRQQARPWAPDEERLLIDAVSCGLSSYFWRYAFPDRQFGEIADRRLELIEAGVVRLAKLI
jgi:hypothetical protein